MNSSAHFLMSSCFSYFVLPEFSDSSNVFFVDVPLWISPILDMITTIAVGFRMVMARSLVFCALFALATAAVAASAADNKQSAAAAKQLIPQLPQVMLLFVRKMRSSFCLSHAFLMFPPPRSINIIDSECGLTSYFPRIAISSASIATRWSTLSSRLGWLTSPQRRRLVNPIFSNYFFIALSLLFYELHLRHKIKLFYARK